MANPTESVSGSWIKTFCDSEAEKKLQLKIIKKISFQKCNIRPYEGILSSRKNIQFLCVGRFFLHGSGSDINPLFVKDLDREGIHNTLCIVM